VETEEMASVRERPTNTFPWKPTRKATIEGFWKLCFLLDPPPGYIGRVSSQLRVAVEKLRTFAAMG
jgi:hypothetical protein